MTDAERPVADGQIVTEEGLRKAEEYVQQEEGAANRLSGWTGMIVTGIAVAMSLFHLYAAYEIVPTQPLRYIHVAFVLVLSFLLFPLAARFRNRIQWFDLIPCVLAIAALGVYRAADGWIGLTVVTPAQWREFCNLLGLEHYAARADMATCVIIGSPETRVVERPGRRPIVYSPRFAEASK